jgi:hypothetical protein
MHQVHQVQRSQHEVQQKHVCEKQRMWLQGIKAVNSNFRRSKIKFFNSCFSVDFGHDGGICKDSVFIVGLISQTNRNQRYEYLFV